MSTAPPTPEYLTYADAASYLRLGRTTLKQAVREGKIPYTRDPLTGRVRFARAELDDWMHGKAKRRSR